MKNISLKVNVFWGLVASLTNPILGVFLNLYLALSRARLNHIGMALSVSLIYSYFPIMWDARNNFVLIFYYSDYDLNTYTRFLYVLTHNIGISYIQAYSILSFITLFIFSRIILGKLIERKDIPYAQYLMCFATFIMCIEYRSIFDLQKTTLAISIILLSFESKKLLLKYVCALLSIAIHPFMILALIAVITSRLLNSLKKRDFFILMVIASLFSLALKPENLSSIAQFLPPVLEKVIRYLNSDDTRFSSEVVSNLVWLLRYVAFCTVCTFCIIAAPKQRSDGNRKKVFVLFMVSLTGVLTSANEVFAERVFILIVILFGYTCVRVNLPYRIFLASFMILFLNVFIHGAHTMRVAHSRDFAVVGSEDLRLSMSAKPLYFPTILLIFHDKFGYSDDIIKKSLH